MSYSIIETCIGCTACTKRCPTNAITGSRNELHVIDPTLCVDCGACGVVCPPEAILDAFGDVTKSIKKNITNNFKWGQNLKTIETILHVLYPVFFL